jgi:tetratricopeptide (TPR) repeat protein
MVQHTALTRLSAAASLVILLSNPAISHPGGKIPVTTTSQAARTAFLQGQDLVDRLRLTDAIPLFRKATEQDPDFALAHLYLAITSPTGSEFWAHLSDAQKFTQRASEGEQLWISGFQAGAYGDPLKQRSLYSKLVALYPDDERAHTLLGTNYFGQQLYEEAARHLQKAVEITPEFTASYNQLGYAYRFLGRYEDAERVFKKYTELLPNDPNPYDSYAELLLKMGRFDEAITQYQMALAAASHFPNSHYGISAALVYKGDYAAAREELQRAIKESRNDGELRGALFSMAVSYVHEGKPDSALKEFEKQYVLGETSDDAGAMAGNLIAMGNIMLESGKPDDALGNFKRALELVQQSDLAPEVKENASRFFRYNHGRVLVQNGYYNDAVKESVEFLKEAQEQGNSNQIRLAHELAGIIALARNEYDEAIRELEQASQQNPYNLYRLAQAYAARGDAEMAKQFALRAANFNSLPALNYAFIRSRAQTMISAL